LTALVVRRGDTVSPRTWADRGVRLLPEFSGGLAAWVAPLNGQGGSASAGGGGGAAAADAQTVFDLLPQAVPGLTEYTVDIDGQQLRYRNAAATWSHFVWPGPGTPGVKITGVTYDGRTVEFFNEPGRYGLEKMINMAQRKRTDSGAFELRWPQGALAVALQLRIISNAATPAPAPAAGTSPSASGRPGALPAMVAGAGDAAVASITAEAKP
jgi:type VI secretion system protein ImpL